MRIHVPEDLSGPRVPEGVYPAVASGYRVRTSANGLPYILWEFTLTGGEAVGRKVFEGTSLTEDALWKLDSLVRATKGEGIPPGDYEVDELINFAVSRVLNQPLTVRIAYELYEGQTRERIKEFRAIR